MTDKLAAALSRSYRIERELGQGGMATVYLAEDLKHHRKVAVKVLRPELAAAMGSDRFAREIEVAARLVHPHILGLIDSGDIDGFFYYVMPYVEGETLRDRIARTGELPVAEAVRLLGEIAEALAVAHRGGVVHRDIKPENILLSGRHAMVMDFGVAKAVTEASGRQQLTTAGMALGTPAYMAPEQASADPQMDGRVDIYALGVMGYEMLTGYPPFHGLNPQQTLAAHVMREPTPLGTQRAGLSPALAAVIMRCLAKRPADRFQTADDLVVALEPLATPSGGMTPTGTMPVSAVQARRPARLAAMVAAGLLLLGAAGYGGYRLLAHPGSASAQSIAVLPFENIGGDTANQSFVLGVQAEIITQLGKLNELRVASRSSALQYRETTKSDRDVASELGVATLLTGSIQRSGGQVHLNIALADAAKGQQLWSESYDRELTPQNLFALQGEIATRVASALSVRLTREQKAAIVKAPTTNLAALDLYYRALDNWSNRGLPGPDTIGVHQLEEAVVLDTSFARAWGLLAQTRSWLLRQGRTIDTVPARLAVDRVKALAPGSLEARLAYGYYLYYGRGNYAGALEEMDAADRLLPNTGEILSARGLLLRRLGRWNEAVALMARAVDLDPRDQSALGNLGETYRMLRRTDDAEEAYSRLLVIDPSNANGIVNKFRVLLDKGDTSQAASFAVSSLPLLTGQARQILRWRLAAVRRDYAEATAAVMTFDTLGGRDITVAQLYRAAGDPVRSRAWADTAIQRSRGVLERQRKRGPEDPFGVQSFIEVQTAIAWALKGDSARAVPMAEQASAAYPPERYAVEGAEIRRLLALTYMLAGRSDDAIAVLRDILQRPGSLSVADLRLDPFWDSLRSDPAFQQLIASGAR